MTGWAFVAMGTTDYLSDPTCGTEASIISGSTPCKTSVNWTSKGICISGTLPALPSSPTDVDFANNWGYSIGVSATDASTGVLGQRFSAVALTVTGTPTSGLRLAVHRAGDPDSVGYCAAMTSGTYVSFSSFTTDCWNSPPQGAALTSADVPNIDRITVQVSSSDVAVAVKDLCLQNIKFALAAH
jgi:hypothetical protein